MRRTGKKCPCKSLHWRFADKRTCDGEQRVAFLQHVLVANNYVHPKIADIRLCNTWVEREALLCTLMIESLLLDMLLEQRDSYANPEACTSRAWSDSFQEVETFAGPHDVAPYEG